MNRKSPGVTSVLLAKRARALKRHLPEARDGDARGVHQARVASRRLREAVPVLCKGVKGTKAGKVLARVRRLTSALGSVRELDVTLEIIDELTTREGLPRPALEEVRRRVVAERDVRRAAMLKRLAHVNVSKLDKRLAAMTGKLAEHESDAWRDALGSRLLKRSKALSAAIAQAGRIYAPEHLHNVRIAAKKLRYGMELAVDAGIAGAEAPLRAVKRVQDTLGRLHDLQVLQTHVAAVQAHGATSTLPDAGLEIVSRALEEECRRLHARYVASIPKLAVVLQTTRSVVVPALARGRQRKRALKMTLVDRDGEAGKPVARVAAASGEQR